MVGVNDKTPVLKNKTDNEKNSIVNENVTAILPRTYCVFGELGRSTSAVELDFAHNWNVSVDRWNRRSMYVIHR